MLLRPQIAGLLSGGVGSAVGWLCRNYIVFEDLLCFLPADKALTALKTLDGDGDGKVSPAEMRDAVLTIYKERKHLAATLSVRPPPRECPTIPSQDCGSVPLPALLPS